MKTTHQLHLLEAKKKKTTQDTLKRELLRNKNTEWKNTNRELFLSKRFDSLCQSSVAADHFVRVAVFLWGTDRWRCAVSALTEHIGGSSISSLENQPNWPKIKHRILKIAIVSGSEDDENYIGSVFKYLIDFNKNKKQHKCSATSFGTIGFKRFGSKNRASLVFRK